MPKKPSKDTGRKAPKGGQTDTAPGDLADLVKHLIRGVKDKFPHTNVPKPLPAGSAGPEIPLSAVEVQRLFVAAASVGNQGSQIWVKDESELLVMTGKVQVRLDEGLIVVTIPVSCDQTGNVSVHVAFAVGSRDKPAGMVAAAEERPRGPAEIVDLWGESLTAFAWRILMSVTNKVAFDTGDDEDREGLIPASITASRGGIRLLTMARHSFDRVIK
jgi:hypothetical protein